MRVLFVRVRPEWSRFIYYMGIAFLLTGILLLAACAAETPTPAEREEPPAAAAADIISVEATGEPNNYQFAVEIASPDQGCSQYADWWEVLAEDGSLRYRRVLLHSHVDEQPFVRSGGPVPIAPDEVVIVRAHMHPSGYGGQVFRGSVRDGFAASSLAASFAAELAEVAPLPQGCAF